MKWHDEWKGTKEEISGVIKFYLHEIVTECKVDRKTAKKYLCEAFMRESTAVEVKKMCNYLKKTY